MKRSSRVRTTAMVVGIPLVLLLAAIVADTTLRSGAQAYAGHPLADNVVAPALALSRTFEQVAARVRPEVVSVYSEKIVKVRSLPFGDDDFFRQFFGDGAMPFQTPQEQSIPQRGMGSGIVIDEHGDILTNHHVVDGVDQIRVRLADQRTMTAKVVGSDAKADIAVIRIEGDVPSNLPIARFGDSDSIRVGDLVLAIGAPFGLTQTVTQGIISATGRSNVGIEDYEDFLQTDAPINPGNSGGPLVDMRGDVVGMNTAIATHLGQSAGVGFAIPANLIQHELPTLLRGGQIARGFLGVTIQDLTPDLARDFHMNGKVGALVSEVRKDSPAERAGIETGDVIVSYDHRPIDDSRELRNAVAATLPGRRVEVGVMRIGRQRSLEVELGSQSGTPLAAAPAPEGRNLLGRLGLEVEPLTPALAQNAGVDDTRGVAIRSIAPGTVASMSGLRPGDVIVEADHKSVATVAQLEHEVAADPKNLLLRVDRRGSSLYVALAAPTS
ncbi:MAG TPA: Do family serine endopeptidase [Candidatus Sulfotelmatobacter sp.]|nr:Do family serine endopeptidase [Candidatus Sulfotelmatobacter sp.]